MQSGVVVVVDSETDSVADLGVELGVDSGVHWAFWKAAGCRTSNPNQLCVSVSLNLRFTPTKLLC